MGTNGEIVVIIVAAGLAFFLSCFVFYNLRKKRCLGCFLQFLTFVVLTASFIICYSSICHTIRKHGAMVCVKNVEKDDYCLFVDTWYLKPNFKYYIEHDKNSHSDSKSPCGNDFWSDYGNFDCSDSTFVIKTLTNPSLVISFDIEKKTVVPIYGNRTIEVVSVDWEEVAKFFTK